ncbi:MAG: VWA domain-containing protein [Pyrinomonadaceae bacterium]
MPDLILQRAACHLHTFQRRPFLRIFSRLFVLALFLSASAGESRAQTDAPANTDEVIRVSTDLIIIPVFVSDSHKRRVPGLTRGDFAVLDEGRAVETAYFAAGAEHVALIFLLDASGSTRDIIERQQETALALFSQFGPRSRVAVMAFDELPRLTLPFTSDASSAGAAFRLAATHDRRTAIFDAALAAVKTFETGATRPTERRIAILISDGLDTASVARASDAVNEARKRGVSFYVIHLPLFTPREGRLVPRPASKGFRDLAEKTGGQFFVVGDARTSLDPHAVYDLQAIFRAIAEDLSGQYVLGYYSNDYARDRPIHRLQVLLTLPAKRNLRVHSLREEYTLKK